ncbi:25S rRNA (cytosine-C(5))-methyltransferase NSUN5 isoform X3 [Solanum stenotomum]|uniref:25S rRNA (cytosine-C(5))-methyltransferase NSUN5 isoform X3 n=1 Tax=Solanum stenotomum TaxID=172797 RepID=UPI0020D13602|nr:25S rRNA (cytosine-C(5))-methyltransferase NSUN5 isoform X3 [Solanum stenotomum]
MGRKKAQGDTKPSAKKPNQNRLSSAERSALFARRESAKVLRTILQGDARRQAVGSIKSLVYSPSVRNKRATYALVCQTLKYLPVIKDVFHTANVLSSKWKRQEELMYIILYDILFGQEALLAGDAEKFLLQKKDVLQAALAKLLVRKKVKHVSDLMTSYKISDLPKPRYARVNTLKMDVESALVEFKKQYEVCQDAMVPDLLIFPPRTDLHDHPLVKSGSVFLQVIDACAAPGNKTVHLAALMKGNGKIIACELNKERVKRLKDTVELAGATNVEVKHEDFLNMSPEDPAYSKVQAILLDPSCSGSGTVVDRLDHLLPSYTAESDVNRLEKLAAFQRKALEHALSFPAVERIVYSTCSINQVENEDVIKSVLPLASSYGFELTTIFPQWPRRGHPIFDGSQHVLRTDLIEDQEGFFIALFVRKGVSPPGKHIRDVGNTLRAVQRRKMRKINSFFLLRTLGLLL